jgi:DNA-binding CsgD family transcriptional regulator
MAPAGWSVPARLATVERKTPVALMPAEAMAIHRIRTYFDFRGTPRECEVLGLFAAGSSGKEIGRLLGISVRTVEAHVRDFCVRNRVRSRLQAVSLWTIARYRQIVSAT